MLVDGSPSASAAPTARSSTASTAGRRRARSGWSSATSRSAGCAEAPEGSGFAPGDLVVGVVRRPDPVPCATCAAGEWDMCRNGRYTERGIKELHGFGARALPVEPDFAVKLDPALGAGRRADGADERRRQGVGPHRAHRRRARRSRRERVLVTGAGPIGLLAALLGAPARARGARARPGDRRPEAGARRATSAPPTTRAPVTRPATCAGHRRRVHRRRRRSCST